MKRPVFSIVTPSFNQGRFLRECLASVQAQGVDSMEHLIFDGASSDESLTVLQDSSEFPALRWVSEKDRGQSHAINKGFRAATGEFIGWLNADDRYRPNCLPAVLQAFQENPAVDIIYGDYTWIDERGKALQLRREISFSRFVLLYHHVLYIPTTAMFFRRRVIDDGHLLNEEMHYAMDFEFFVRLSHAGYRFMHFSQTLADFRFHGESKSVLRPESQLAEQACVVRQYSPILRRCAPRFVPPVKFALQLAAGTRRYIEKAVRGYYFTQFQPR